MLLLCMTILMEHPFQEWQLHGWTCSCLGKVQESRHCIVQRYLWTRINTSPTCICSSHGPVGQHKCCINPDVNGTHEFLFSWHLCLWMPLNDEHCLHHLLGQGENKNNKWPHFPCKTCLCFNFFFFKKQIHAHGPNPRNVYLLFGGSGFSAPCWKGLAVLV